ncbi:MAG: hypothetical protein M0Z59_05795 [Nitrospiraceae bacterium]|nr:hypothetical protein [Nitrospiraceae bacterium]
MLSAGSTAASIVGQNKQARAETEAANKAAQADYDSLEQKQKEIAEQESLQQFERERQGRRERALMTVNAGGLSGNTLLREQLNSMLQESFDIGILKQNKENQTGQTLRDMNAVYAQAQGRRNAAVSKMISPLMAGLQIGTSGLQGYETGYTIAKQLGLDKQPKGSPRG